jgi:hypothetical protein
MTSLYDGNSAFKLHRMPNQDNTKVSQFKRDVFGLGSLLLVSALGGLDIVDTQEIERIEGGCCLLHKEEEKSQEGKKGCIQIAGYFTSKRYSQEFLDFLCKCLRFSEEGRATVGELLNHSWLVGKPTLRTANVSLQELIQISNQWRQVVPLLECQGPAEKQLERVCEAMAAVLPCCENFETIIKEFMERRGDEEMGRELALDLGLETKDVWEKLLAVIQSMLSINKK